MTIMSKIDWNELERYYDSCLSEESTDIIDIITWEQGWRHIVATSCYTLYFRMIEDKYLYP
jgi:hypothetical protein